MAKVTFPDGSVRNVDRSNESQQFNDYVALSRSKGIDVDPIATSQAFEMTVGNPGAFSPIPVQTTVLGDASLSIMNATPAPVAELWTGASNFTVGAAQSTASHITSAAKSASSFITDEAHKAAAALENGLGISATVAELAAVAIIAAAAVGIVYMVRHPAARAALL